MKKKALIFSPIMVSTTQKNMLLKSLDFWEQMYEFDCWDLLEDSDKDHKISASDFYEKIWQKLHPVLEEYSMLIGFSLGGVVLQQLFARLEHQTFKGPVLLFSTPSFVDSTLKEKLNRVYELNAAGKLQEAHEALLKPVVYPNPLPAFKVNEEDPYSKPIRLLHGLTRVLLILQILSMDFIKIELLFPIQA
jgi:hypothetical protein